MAVKKIIEVGHRVLKLKNKPIINFESSNLKGLIRDLIDTMRQVDLIGIAAPQIGQNYQLFITQPRKTKARNLGKNDKLRIFINPSITFFSTEKTEIYEGCGCVPDSSIFGPVIRSKEIEVVAFDEKEQKFCLRCDGILARVIQHEYDHLLGIEFLEKVTDNKKIISSKNYFKNIRSSKEQIKASKINKIEYKRFVIQD